MTNLPRFLRFDRVKFNYRTLRSGYATANLPIAKKCQSVVNYLRRLKLKDSNLIHFICTIKDNSRSDFSDHSQLIDHLQNELLTICGSSRRYTFGIWFYSDKASHTNLIAEILQMPQIDCCSNVKIKLIGFATRPIQLPIESISNWLHQNCDGKEEKSNERFLRIYLFNFNSLCTRELVDHLKKVTIVHLFENFG